VSVPFHTISKWENGVNYPDITHIPRLSDIFGVSADVILGLVPFENKDERKRYDEVDFWADKRDVVKVWKNLYWNDDRGRRVIGNDEAPFAYRTLDDIREVIGETIKIDKIIKPVYNYKMGG
jgi:transcriptional regulator with XRE-family HTH domain